MQCDLDSAVSCPEEGEHGVQVVLPLGPQPVHLGLLGARELGCDLQAVGEQVVVVLHAVVHRVPLRPRCDATAEGLTVTQTLSRQIDG